MVVEMINIGFEFWIFNKMYVSYVKQNERNAYDKNRPQNRYFSPKKEMDSIYFKSIYVCIEA